MPYIAAHDIELLNGSPRKKGEHISEAETLDALDALVSSGLLVWVDSVESVGAPPASHVESIEPLEEIEPTPSEKKEPVKGRGNKRSN
jgi:hypothetical protein